jgi:guanylate kinase
VRPKGRLFIVSGPSGVGKSTLIDRFLREDAHSTFSISCTTRPKRPHEIEGKDYYFIEQGRFRELVGQDHFLEWEEVHGYCYGTPAKEILDNLERGVDVVLDIDVKGALTIRQKCPRAYLIFIEPPSVDDLIQRLSSRGEQEIAKRMQRVREEMSRKDLFDCAIINDKLSSAYETFKSVISEARRQEHGKDNC